MEYLNFGSPPPDEDGELITQGWVNDCVGTESGSVSAYDSGQISFDGPVEGNVPDDPVLDDVNPKPPKYVTITPVDADPVTYEYQEAHYDAGLNRWEFRYTGLDMAGDPDPIEVELYLSFFTNGSKYKVIYTRDTLIGETLQGDKPITGGGFGVIFELACDASGNWLKHISMTTWARAIQYSLDTGTVDENFDAADTSKNFCCRSCATPPAELRVQIDGIVDEVLPYILTERWGALPDDNYSAVIHHYGAEVGSGVGWRAEVQIFCNLAINRPHHIIRVIDESGTHASPWTGGVTFLKTADGIVPDFNGDLTSYIPTTPDTPDFTVSWDAAPDLSHLGPSFYRLCGDSVMALLCGETADPEHPERYVTIFFPTGTTPPSEGETYFVRMGIIGEYEYACATVIATVEGLVPDNDGIVDPATPGSLEGGCENELCAGSGSGSGSDSGSGSGSGGEGGGSNQCVETSIGLKYRDGSGISVVPAVGSWYYSPADLTCIQVISITNVADSSECGMGLAATWGDDITGPFGDSSCT